MREAQSGKAPVAFDASLSERVAGVIISGQEKCSMKTPASALPSEGARRAATRMGEAFSATWESSWWIFNYRRSQPLMVRSCNHQGSAKKLFCTPKVYQFLGHIDPFREISTLLFVFEALENGPVAFPPSRSRKKQKQ
jgi:hypothetical protein